MSKPTRMQTKVLKAVHVHAATARVMQDRAKATQQTTGQSPPASWYQDVHGRAVLRQELENAATAAGIPAVWVAQVRERGDLGMRWRADVHWRAPQFIDRDQLLKNLEQQVRGVQDMAAVAAVHGERGAKSEVGTAQMFDRTLRVLTQRINAVAAVLEVSATEAEQLWGAHTWSTAAEGVRDHNHDTLADRWRAHARTDTTDLALQAKALTDAGITAGTRALPAPSDMTELIRAQLSPTTPPETGTGPAEPGAQITEAIEVAGITSDTATELVITDSPDQSPATTTDLGIEP
ncbi:hypothetical protein GFY24_36955 [Nocardia sp. SYP-A9097]|uniref:hypothetical protein n=1 Tax=Nocardia sp. SYP-A9097 TaxID=2663237 RepID=UPI00129BBBEE|nr:hypothetical protein [Nocardia sp. SYP-A9097]MRH92947.1 hypothetical protein [Nocardia sp. SYP-A9097]